MSAATDTDFRTYYHLEAYLFDTVGPRFHTQGHLSAFDFYCIVIWKANRAKSKIARRLLVAGHPNLEAAVRALTEGIARQPSTKDRLCYLLRTWGFRLSMASAILTVLYPDDFTVYDVRVCETLGGFHDVGRLADVERICARYTEFRRAVEAAVPASLTLRDKDRYLWGRSFHRQLTQDIALGFMEPLEESQLSASVDVVSALGDATEGMADG